MDSFIPGIDELFAALLSVMGFPSIFIAIGLTLYTAYGWYASGRWAATTARSTGGRIAVALRESGGAVIWSAVQYGVVQLIFIAMSILLGQLLLLITADAAGTSEGFDTGDPVGSMNRALTSTSYEYTQEVIIGTVILSFFPLIGAVISSPWGRRAFAAIAGPPGMIFLLGTALFGLFAAGSWIAVLFGNSGMTESATIFSISFGVLGLWVFSALMLFSIGKPAESVV